MGRQAVSSTVYLLPGLGPSTVMKKPLARSPLRNQGLSITLLDVAAESGVLMEMHLGPGAGVLPRL
jgi:hypothetical protein